MSINNAVKELENYCTTGKTQSRTGIHRKCQVLNSDWHPSGRMLTSDIKKRGRKREFEENENESLM